MTFRYSGKLLGFGVLLLAPFAWVPAFSQTPLPSEQTQRLEAEIDFTGFVPGVKLKNTRLDYGIWDEALQSAVIDFGPSLRNRARYPHADIGSRIVRGHTSPYRLEGSRVTFAYLQKSYRSALTKYREDLQDIAGRVDLTSLSRDEQLAFWFNLHNVALIEKIAQDYPVRRPDQIKIMLDGQEWLLDDAPFITVLGQAISLRDIRENIVFQNWSDPDVIYGFFRGNIGSPKLPNHAYTSGNLEYRLSANGREFVNALRGFQETGGKRRVSQIYEDAAPYYFPDFEKDLTAHLLGHAIGDTVDEVNSDKPIAIDRYDYMIADLAGGSGLTAFGAFIASPADTAALLGGHGKPGLAMNMTGSNMTPAHIRRMIREVDHKYQILVRKDLLDKNTGTVIIEDLPTSGDPLPQEKKDQPDKND